MREKTTDVEHEMLNFLRIFPPKKDKFCRPISSSSNKNDYNQMRTFYFNI